MQLHGAYVIKHTIEMLHSWKFRGHSHIDFSHARRQIDAIGRGVKTLENISKYQFFDFFDFNFHCIKIQISKKTEIFFRHAKALKVGKILTSGRKRYGI